MNKTTHPSQRVLWLQYLSLFSSFGTLLCCALPSLLVLIGLGATVASILSAAPWLVTLSHHKNLVFGVSGVLIGGNIVYTRVVAPRLGSGCAIDEDDACVRASRITTAMLWISVAIYAIGVLVAYILGPFLLWLDNAN